MQNLFDKDLLLAIGAIITSRKQTVATAESVTSGFLQGAISNIPDASDFFQGGITAYNLSQKYKHLNVEPIHAAEVNCVSEKVAREMATGCINNFSSDWGLAVTGYATAVPESGNELFAYYAISFQQNIVTVGRIEPDTTDPLEAQIWYTNEILRQWKSFLDHA